MKEIAKNNYYELYYDESKNCVYWIMKSFWKELSVVPNFNKDWDEVKNLAKKVGNYFLMQVNVKLFHRMFRMKKLIIKKNPWNVVV